MSTLLNAIVLAIVFLVILFCFIVIGLPVAVGYFIFHLSQFVFSWIVVTSCKKGFLASPVVMIHRAEGIELTVFDYRQFKNPQEMIEVFARYGMGRVTVATTVRPGLEKWNNWKSAKLQIFEAEDFAKIAQMLSWVLWMFVVCSFAIFCALCCTWWLVPSHHRSQPGSTSQKGVLEFHPTIRDWKPSK